jgi:hypothetical protein
MAGSPATIATEVDTEPDCPIACGNTVAACAPPAKAAATGITTMRQRTRKGGMAANYGTMKETGKY